jgi:SAM-dependent methyltransferase
MTKAALSLATEPRLRLSPRWWSQMACPGCGGPLDVTTPLELVSCTRCGATYRIEDGVVNFNVQDTFYDEHGFVGTGREFPSTLLGRVGLYFARHQHLYDISRVVRPGAAVIEIGCGGGSRYLGSSYDVLGVDVSAKSVQQAARAYQSVVQATAEKLPLRDGSADAIVSSCLLEHLGDDVVGGCIAEMARVLRPGGFMVHFLDLDNDGPFYRWAKRQAWHRDVFVTQKGHAGLRALAAWRRLFEQSGFRERRRRLFNKTWLQDLTIWAALDNPLVDGFPRRLGRAAMVVIRRSGIASDVTINVIHNCIEGWLPDRWAAKAILTLEKPR